MNSFQRNPFVDSGPGLSHLSKSDAMVLSQLGRALAASLRDTVDAPLPDRLAKLLRQVDRKLQSSG